MNKTATALLMFLLTFLLLGIASPGANASNFMGYKKQTAGKFLKFTEVIERIRETPHSYLILMSRHEAFYEFPKTANDAAQIKDFLTTRMKKNSMVDFEVNPLTAEILTMGDHK
jgi:hypothetical protein